MCALWKSCDRSLILSVCVGMQVIANPVNQNKLSKHILLQLHVVTNIMCSSDHLCMHVCCSLLVLVCLYCCSLLHVVFYVLLSLPVVLDLFLSLHKGSFWAVI